MTVSLSEGAVEILGRLVGVELRQHNKVGAYMKMYSQKPSEFFNEQQGILEDLDNLFNPPVKV